MFKEAAGHLTIRTAQLQAAQRKIGRLNLVIAGERREYAEFEALLKRVDRITYHNSQRWAYYDEVNTKLWYVREEFRRDSREVWHGPSVLDALRVLVAEIRKEEAKP